MFSVYKYLYLKLILFKMSAIEESKLTEFDAKLKDNMFLSGNVPGAADAEALELMQKAKFVPDQAKHPNVWAWYALVVLFEAKVVGTWTKAVAEPKKGGKAPKAQEPKKEEAKPAEEDDMDFFGEQTEEEKKQLEELKKKKDDKKKDKKKDVQKSLILLEVKGWESDQDLDALALKIQTVQMEGLQWKSEYKLAEVAFGVKKIVIGLVVEDDKVSVDDIIDQLQAWEDEVQSVDIISFNKL